MNHLAGAPATVFSGTQGKSRRSPKSGGSVNLGNGGIPTVVGATSPYFGSILTEVYAWAANAQNMPVPESTMSAVPANAVSGPISVASTGQDNSNEFAATYFDWVIQLNINSRGTTGLVVHFGDGTSGTIPIYIYDEWYFSCAPSANAQWGYNPVSVVPEGSFTDMTLNCNTQSVTITDGGVQIASPVADTYGNVATAFTTVANQTESAAAGTQIQASALVPGSIWIIKLFDGGYAKVMPLVNDGTSLVPNISGISLHDSPSGSGQFAF
ncbi:MAG: hypothetical protein ABR949_10150 [Candidatus Aquilonibacter sp.]